ncbi:multicopper oxidase domain-containing protein [Mycobacterium sp.]|uniref:multicopper oxidase domain-containing protein n=1 Tax=Mycobacterium sp. TaxID=1785 RepID=UPI0025EA3B98|nr:multicopper oxidase domain-containing protein [Mycobacterium sp.]
MWRSAPRRHGWPTTRHSGSPLSQDPGVWMLHCHNTYHQAAGMMTRLDYAI